MEKAILKTLIYADIFDYPLKINQIHKWLIGKKATLRQLEKALGKLNRQSRINSFGKYYFLPKRFRLVSQRNIRKKQSAAYLRKAKILCQILKVVPWVKLVGISGALAWDNVSKKDDIDIIIITSKNRIWISRLFCLGLLSLVGQRRKKGERGRKIAGKLCINILLEEDKLDQINKDIYVAHEVLQMRPLWYKDGIYSKYLSDNNWAFNFLPNWLSWQYQSLPPEKSGRQNYKSKFKIIKKFCALTFNLLEKYTRKLQLWYMKSPTGLERITDGALYFHPQDCRKKVLNEYQRRLN